MANRLALPKDLLGREGNAGLLFYHYLRDSRGTASIEYVLDYLTTFIADIVDCCFGLRWPVRLVAFMMWAAIFCNNAPTLFIVWTPRHDKIKRASIIVVEGQGGVGLPSGCRAALRLSPRDAITILHE